MVLPLGDVEKTRIVPIATWVLIALNVAMYMVELDLGEVLPVAPTPPRPTRSRTTSTSTAPFDLNVEPDEVDGLMPLQAGER